MCFVLVPTDAPGSIDGKALSATEAVVWWFPITQSNIDGYQVGVNYTHAHDLKIHVRPFTGQDTWLSLLHLTLGSQVKYWRKKEDTEGGAHTVVASGRENHTRVDGMKPDSLYLIEIRGYNSAGYGPASERLEIHTKKPRTFAMTNRMLSTCVVQINIFKVCNLFCAWSLMSKDGTKAGA